MSQRTFVVYTCDLCGKEVEERELIAADNKNGRSGWISVRVADPLAEALKVPKRHACPSCAPSVFSQLKIQASEVGR